LRYAPLLFLSALAGKGISPLLKILLGLLGESQKQFTKRELEEAVKSLSTKNPISHKGQQLKIYFAKHHPGLTPYFIFFVNNPRLIHFSYQRYIINYLRKNLALEYLPIKLVFKKS
jgi:GTP-binding protein